jgi:topoisomerase IV subunit A
MKDEEEDNTIPNPEDNPSEENSFDENQDDDSDEIIEVEAKHFEGQHFYENDENPEDTITKVTGMYKDWFLDYASYVILERAVPAIEDGFKPVQRRIMHSLKELDDGRYNKVANVVGHTMQYHPHGDASIGDAMVQIGQRELLIDCQGTGEIYLLAIVQPLLVILKRVCQNLLWKFCILLKLPIGECPTMVVVQNPITYQ